ncbi:ArsC family reductase [Marinomonas sp. IMCC 4694]|uniref:ArsC family reductase n=1 Tax=Marinomonas sp. IMCC 4694 TaxID=2605432 RepID=UPI0011E6E855|nr:ArsC family reductase [Marinomonas sp. IMCC 4694]TYL47229.1 ArsC family reductase [Marinomonas sp. IMCC 4694]
MIDIYGIKNCDTMKKAFRWLDEQQIEYRFHDYKKEDLEETQAKLWVEEFGWESVINKRGTTWRKLDDSIKKAMSNDQAINIMIAQPSIIKRPILSKNGTTILGFTPVDYANNLL